MDKSIFEYDVLVLVMYIADVSHDACCLIA